MTINTQAPGSEELKSSGEYGEHSEPGDAGQDQQRAERSAPNVWRPTVYCPESKVDECLGERHA